jgi:hypothetical protein
MRLLSIMLATCLIGSAAFGDEPNSKDSKSAGAGRVRTPPVRATELPPVPAPAAVSKSPETIAPKSVPALTASPALRIQQSERTDQYAVILKIEEKMTELAKSQVEYGQRAAAFSGDIMMISVGIFFWPCFPLS